MAFDKSKEGKTRIRSGDSHQDPIGKSAPPNRNPWVADIGLVEPQNGRWTVIPISSNGLDRVYSSLPSALPLGWFWAKGLEKSTISQA